jgi:ubiquinone biosynthesis protein
MGSQPVEISLYACHLNSRLPLKPFLEYKDLESEIPDGEPLHGIVIQMHASEFATVLAAIREGVAASDLLPPMYAKYRPLLGDGLRFFLERLPRARLKAMLADQASLPMSTPTAQRVVALAHHSPVLHKLGQVVARDRRLTPSFRKRLQELESLEPRTPVVQVQRQLDRELPGWRKAGIILGAELLAEGSVAVVMPFLWPDSSVRPRPRSRPRPRFPKFGLQEEDEDEDEKDTAAAGVFKLLKPGIEQRLEEDLEILGLLGSFLDQDCGRYHLPSLDYRQTFDTIRELLLHEVRLKKEQRHLEEAAGIYSGIASVAIPALLPFCSARVTAMERLCGHKLGEEHLADGQLQRAVAQTIAQALIAQPMFTGCQAALFHADPHAGNLLVTPQGQVGILDWSLTGRLDKEDRIQLMQMLMGALELDAEKVQTALVQLSQSPPRADALREAVHESLRELCRGAWPGMAWLTGLLDRVVLRAGVRFDVDLVLFRKSLLTLEGVLADVAPREDAPHTLLDEAVQKEFLKRWFAEWPERFLAPPTSRSFGTHLSSADLCAALWSGPAAALRWWTATADEFLRPKGG